MISDFHFEFINIDWITVSLPFARLAIVYLFSVFHALE